MEKIDTHLVKKVAKIPRVCTNCRKKIEEGEIYHREEGINKHLHSLIAREFCTECYSKYGQEKLIKGQL
jgi:hypothetical protein